MVTPLRPRSPSLPLTPPSGRWDGIRSSVGRIVAGVVSVIRGQTTPVTSHLREHFYSIAGLSCIAGAAFTHSLFAGLLVTGVLILIFEWKVGD